MFTIVFIMFYYVYYYVLLFLLCFIILLLWILFYIKFYDFYINTLTLIHKCGVYWYIIYILYIIYYQSEGGGPRTDYCTSWAREWTGGLAPVDAFFVVVVAVAVAATHWSPTPFSPKINFFSRFFHHGGLYNEWIFRKLGFTIFLAAELIYRHHGASNACRFRNTTRKQISVDPVFRRKITFWSRK